MTSSLNRPALKVRTLNEEQREERIVPFADKRSIRRVILHPGTFDDLA